MGKLIKEFEQINASKHMEISSLANKELQIKKINRNKSNEMFS